MAQYKQTLEGVINLGMAVKTADGILEEGDKVKISDDMEVEKVDTAQDNVFGRVCVPNKEASGTATITTRGKRVDDQTTGAAYDAGEFLGVDSTGRMIRATAANSTGTVTVSDYSAIDSGDTVTVNGVTLTAGGTDWTATSSNAATALSIATAINNKVSGVKASVAPSSAVVTIQAITPGAGGNSITLATSMDTGTEGTVSGATLSGGRDFYPMAIALEASSTADETKSVLWLV